MLAWQVFVTLASLAGLVAGMWASLNFTKRAAHDSLAQKFSEKETQQDVRLTKIETSLNDVPKRRDLDLIYTQVTNVGSRVSNLEGQTRQNNKLLGAIHDHLLNQKGGGK
ncbi:DUF2730 family protein [Polycyclovorans algicola]|uniref:DUF2730 family protein n=1 Tax=Polycyclovorans algicola TaxID=616992 RepID=UPI0004A74B80|nr:DUF2730 family protein [Polycyclovorans algicola]